MKKIVFPLFIAFALVVLPTAVSRAQSVAKLPPQANPVASTTPAATPDDEKLPLVTRRDNVVVQLRELNTRLTTFTTRTQLALDRLDQKNIATGKAQEELTIALSNLASAKLATDTLATVVIPGTDQEKVVVSLKASVVSIQDQLKEARTHLINALVLVKTALTATLETDTLQ